MEHSIVFLDRASVGATLRKPDFPHTYREYDSSTADQVVERLKGATIAITNKIPIRAAALAQLPDLQFIAVAATGTDIVDKAPCKARGIPVSNIRGYAFNTVPEHVFTLIFALRRNLIAYREDVKRGRWQTVDTFCLFDHPIHDVAGSTIGIVGYGALGKGVGKIAQAFGMKILAMGSKPGPDRVDLETILREADIVVLQTPLTDATRNMIGAAELKTMKPSAILINCSRGGLVDEAALVQALRTGTIAGAGFDVLTTEPPKQGNPLIDLLDLPNFILTPHVAWASREAMQILADQLIDNVEAFVGGAPRNLVE
ncbi:MAG TPA: D-2-hydroxyacid dehydrogenase [Magnetospirillaceae bacterium]|jgi:glycerate dehydrogenase